MKISNIWRLLRILLIFSRKTTNVKAKELAQALEISVRQVYRDIECLKQASVPIYSDKNGFSLMPDFYMPKISLETPEILTLLILCSSIKAQKGTPYCELLTSACDKIVNALPDGLKKVFLNPAYDVMVDFGLDTKVDYRKIEELFSLIYEASIAKKQILISYYGIDTKDLTERVVDPYAFKLNFGIWYLIGFCHLREQIRTFRIDRIRKAEVLRDAFEIPENFNIDDYFRGSWGIVTGPAFKVKLKFSSSIADFISECTWHPSQKLSKNKNGSLNAEFNVDGLNEIKIWVMGFGENVEVLEPAELRKDIVKTLEQTMLLYKLPGKT
jgi:predicted DNA-binding transcriptional regulator YafY